jgi:hypothetical protein
LPWPENREGWAWDSRQRIKWDGDEKGGEFILKRQVTWEELKGAVDLLPLVYNPTSEVSHRVWQNVLIVAQLSAEESR